MIKIDAEKDFLENLDYLKQLVKLIKSKSISEFDQNLTYEVIYADAYVENIIPQVEDTELVATLGDIKTALDLVVSKIPMDEVNKQRESKDYEKLLKAKYTDESRGSYLVDKPYESVDSPIKFYVKRRVPFIFTLALFTIVLLCGGASIITDLLPEPTRGNVEAFKTLSSLICLISNLLIMLCVSLGTLSLTLDLLYLTIPAIRAMLDRDGHNRLYSIYAKSAIEQYDNQLVYFKKVKSYDRIKRNLYWLDSMISNMKVMDLNTEQKALYERLKDLKLIFDTSKQHNTSEYYRNVAKIEFLHNEYLKLYEE